MVTGGDNMGMFEHFPYTNFHDLNLDALAQAVGSLKADVDGLLEEAKAYTDQIKAKVDREMAAQITQVQHLLAAGQAEIDDKIDVVESLLGDYLNAAENYTDDKVSNLRIYVDNQLAGIGVDVINPVTGQLSTIQDAIYSLYGLHTDDTLTASEYDALHLTATVYDGKHLTASNYDLRGKTLLP